MPSPLHSPDQVAGAPSLAMAPAPSTRWELWAFLLISMAFLLIRVPVMYLHAGGEDEDCYAIPGLTILKTGLPQLPHVPARNLDSVYYYADRILFSEPPLMFYLQSLFYLVLPDVHGTPRMLSAVCGLISLALLWQLCRRWVGSGMAAAWGLALFSASRWFYFPATRARPDIVAVVLGFAVLAAMCRWETSRRLRWIVVAGVCIGLGGLAHPFAMAYALQAAVWLMWTSRGWHRLADPALLTAVSLATTCLWLPLILMEPEAFRVQFSNQFLAGQDESLPYRLLMPWKSLWYHGRSVWQHLGPWQFFLGFVPLIAASISSFRNRDAKLGLLCVLSWTSFYLIAAIVGAHHPTLGYWAYPAGLMFLTTGWVIDGLLRRTGEMTKAPQICAAALGLILTASMIPGSGLRTLAAYIQHWGDPTYNVTAFSRQLMDRIPADQTCVVDTQFALDFIAAGRKVLLAQTIPFYFEADKYPYDKLIISRYGLQTDIKGRMCTTPLRWELGREKDIFACYAEVYEQAEFPCPPEKQTPLRPTGREF